MVGKRHVPSQTSRFGHALSLVQASPLAFRSWHCPSAAQ
jgi:hypothetical protein